MPRSSRRCSAGGLVRVRHRVVFGSLEAVNAVFAALGCQINTAFVERLNLTIRQHIAAVGRRVSTLCKGEDWLQQQLSVFHCYYNFCLPHTSLRRSLPQPEPTTGGGSATQWRPCTPAMAAGLTDHVEAGVKCCSFARRRGHSQRRREAERAREGATGCRTGHGGSASHGLL